MDRPDQPIVQAVVLPAAPSVVWSLIATDAGLCRWYAHHASIEPRVGGRYAFGWEPDQDFEGRITAWTPGDELAFWQPSEVGVAAAGDNATLVEFRLRPDDEQPGATVLGVRHSGFARLLPRYTPVESRRASDVSWRIAFSLLAALLGTAS